MQLRRRLRAGPRERPLACAQWTWGDGYATSCAVVSLPISAFTHQDDRHYEKVPLDWWRITAANRRRLMANQRRNADARQANRGRDAEASEANQVRKAEASQANQGRKCGGESGESRAHSGGNSGE